MKVRLGSSNQEYESLDTAAYSLNRLVQDYSREMDEQFGDREEGSFLIKHSLMHEMEHLIFMEEACHILNTLLR